MKNSQKKFISKMVENFPFLLEEMKSVEAYWNPDSPPVTVLYAAIGQKIADCFDSLNYIRRDELFRLIESGMEGADEEIATAVATGLIESMIGRASRQGGVTSILDALRPVSRAYAHAWLEQ